ncbi:MAG: hypothetical protein ABIG42_07715 [bacterium]
MLSTRISLFIVFLIMFCITGCSSGHNSPVIPESTSSGFPIGVSDYFSDGTPQAGTGTLGLFFVHIDPIKLNGEISPLRNTSLEDVLEIVDITNFLQIAPCTDCVKLHSVSINTDENLVLSIGIRHPFPAGDPEKTISGQNRGDLHVFNVEGYIIADGSTPGIFPSLGKTVGDFKLVNADGFSAYLDSSWDEFLSTTATIHPYITHFDDYSQGNFDPSNPMGFYSVTDPPPSGNLVMPMGSAENIQDYILDIPLNNPIDFMFAIGCTYAVSAASKLERFTPEYRIPQHNKKAASEVSVEIITNDLTAGDPLSSATLHVKVVDINHAVTVGAALNEMRADSSVGGILVEIPGVTTSSVPFSTTPISGTGHDPTDPLIFEGTVMNEQSAPEATYNGLVKVLDTYQPGYNETPLLNRMDGIKRVDPIQNPLDGLFTITEFATYQTFSIFVEEVCTVPTDVVYNLILSTVRSATDEVTALRLDWDTQAEATDYFIYRKDPFDSLSSYAQIIDGVNTNNFYEDSSIQGNEGYQYYISGEFCGVEANSSNKVLALLENGEDNVSTASVWETECGNRGNLTPKYTDWGICTNDPANGSSHWSYNGWHLFDWAQCVYLTSHSWSILCSPEIPLPANASTAYIEYNVMVNLVLQYFDQQAGGSVGVADAVLNDNYWPSNDYREGWQYNCPDVLGLSEIWSTGKANFPNCNTTNDYGYGYRTGEVYYYAAYNLPDLLTLPNARAAIVYGSANASPADPSQFSYDDIAIIVY